MEKIRQKIVRQEIFQNYIRGFGIEIWTSPMLLDISHPSNDRYLPEMPVVPLRQQYADVWRYNQVSINLVENEKMLSSISDNSCDFVLVNHQLERCQDPISAIRNYLRVLKPGGVVYLASSDKRYTFNCYRPALALDRLILNYMQSTEESRSSYLEEWIRLVEIPIFDVPEDKFSDRLQYHLENHSKIHFHVWTQKEFIELILYCKNHLDIELEIENFKKNDSELIGILKKSKKNINFGEPLLDNELNHIYQVWLKRNFPRPSDLRQMADTLELFKNQPLISIIMPVFNAPEPFLRSAIESVLNQIYPYWELCVADDASTAPHIEEILKEYAALDSRIKLIFREQNGHISRASNSALEIANGEFVALLDHDDMLTPDALYEVALLLNRHRDADMIYSDEDKIDESNHLRDPFFKPDWCPDSFLSRMYTCHLGIYRRSLLNAIGGFRVGYEGSQDYDLVLRFTEKTDKIYHIPKILYHWRSHPDSTASDLENKNYATDAAVQAITEALYRRSEPGLVQTTVGGHAIVRYYIKEYSRVSIIIPTRDLASILDTCLTSIFEKTIYPNYEVIVIDNGSQEAETAQLVEKWRTQEPNRFRCEPLDIPFNYSKLNNYAVTKAEGQYLLFLNNDTEVVTPDWVNAMVEQAQRPSIGAIGALLLYPDNTIQHAGVALGLGGVASHSHKYFSHKAPGYFFQIQTVNNYSAVTAACLMCRRDVFEAVGGFEEDLQIAFNDIDFCLKILEKNYRNIYLPHVILYHYESKSRGYEDTPEKQARFAKEIEYMRRKWQKIIHHDPCYSPNLTRDREDYSINL